MNEIADTAKISSLADIETSERGSKLIVGPGAMIDSFVKIKCAFEQFNAYFELLLHIICINSYNEIVL